MRPTFDFTPIFRSSIGFDRLLNALETSPGPTLREVEEARPIKANHWAA